MEKPSFMQRTKRRYDLLVDIALIAFFVQSIDFLLRLMGYQTTPTTGVWDLVSAVGFYGTWLLLIVLVFARSLRDEYAQAIWDRTAGTFCRFTAVAATPVFIAMGVFAGLNEDWLATLPAERMILGTNPRLPTNPSAQQYIGMMKSVFLVNIYFPFFFMLFYRARRWLESR